jgi:hypothetical protein
MAAKMLEMSGNVLSPVRNGPKKVIFNNSGSGHTSQKN